MRKTLILATVALLLAGAASAQYVPGTCYWGLNGASIVCQSGATLQVDASATFSLFGSSVTATGTELNYLDVTTLGTAQASKALTADSSIDVTGVRNFTITGATTAATAVFGGGYGSTGASISAAGVGQFNGALTTDGALTADSVVIGGGYGSTGATVSNAGVLQIDGAFTTASSVTADSVVVGGGYGATGATISAAGALQIDDALTVDGTSVLTGAVSTGSTLTVAGDVTLSAPGDGGNALAKTEFVGLPRIMNVGIGTMANGATNTVIVDIGDSETPATDWTAIDADVVMTDDGTYYRQGTASLKMAVAATADATDGCTNTLATGDQDWTDDESVGMWFYADTTLVAGDLTLVITDSVAGDTSVDFPAYATADTWQWIEIDVSGVAAASKDVITDLSIELSAAGAAVAAAGAFNVYMDFIVKWDGAEEESLGAAILSDGVLSLTVIDATDTAATSANLTLYTDFFIHYQSGNDAVVMITDQSGADKVGLALIAY